MKKIMVFFSIAFLIFVITIPCLAEERNMFSISLGTSARPLIWWEKENKDNNCYSFGFGAAYIGEIALALYGQARFYEGDSGSRFYNSLNSLILAGESSVNYLIGLTRGYELRFGKDDKFFVSLEGGVGLDKYHNNFNSGLVGSASFGWNY